MQDIKEDTDIDILNTKIQKKTIASSSNHNIKLEKMKTKIKPRNSRTN